MSGVRVNNDYFMLTKTPRGTFGGTDVAALQFFQLTDYSKYRCDRMWIQLHM